MIRKEAKARWVYTCKPCGLTAAYPDQFRAIERQQRHERTFSHFGNAFGTALKETFAPILSSVGWALDPWQEEILTRAMWERGRE